MDTTKKMEDPEKRTIQLVLEEHTQEQVNNTKAVNDLIAAVNTLTGKVKGLEEKLDEPTPINVSADTRPVQEIVKKGVTWIFRVNPATVSQQTQPFISRQTRPVGTLNVKIYHC